MLMPWGSLNVERTPRSHPSRKPAGWELVPCKPTSSGKSPDVHTDYRKDSIINNLGHPGTSNGFSFFRVFTGFRGSKTGMLLLRSLEPVTNGEE